MAVLQAPKVYPCSSCDCDKTGRPSDGSRWKIKSVIDEQGQPFVSEICPRRVVSNAAWELIALWRHFKQGVMPVGGGLLDQPAIYCRAMEFIDAAVANHHGGP